MENNLPTNGEPYNSGTPPKKPNTVVVVLVSIFLPFVALILLWTVWKNAWTSKKKAILTAVLAIYTVIWIAVAAWQGNSQPASEPITSSSSQSAPSEEPSSVASETPEPTEEPTP